MYYVGKLVLSFSIFPVSPCFCLPIRLLSSHYIIRLGINLPVGVEMHPVLVSHEEPEFLNGKIPQIYLRLLRYARDCSTESFDAMTI